MVGKREGMVVLSMKQVEDDGKVWQLKQVYWVLPPVDWCSHNDDDEAEEEGGDEDDDDVGFAPGSRF